MKFKDVTEEMNALYERKNHDYGNSFSETFRKLGIIRAATRMLDKMNRIVSLVTKDQQKETMNHFVIHLLTSPTMP